MAYNFDNLLIANLSYNIGRCLFLILKICFKICRFIFHIVNYTNNESQIHLMFWVHLKIFLGEVYLRVYFQGEVYLFSYCLGV